jgi:gas vesicle protein
MKAFEYLAAGIAIGAAVSAFLAPQSGEETRKWIANKCLDGIEAANERVWQSRVQLGNKLDRGQRQISQLVAAGRESFDKPDSLQSPVTLL